MADLTGLLKQILVNFENYTKLKKDQINAIVMNPMHQQMYTLAFTHKSVDSVFNYEINEFNGDAILKHITIRYINSKWPYLSVPQRTRLSQYMYSTKELGRICEDLLLTQYINIDTSDETAIKNIKVKEDVFEAFLGATEIICDTVFGFGSGYIILFSFMSTYWDSRRDLNPLELSKPDPISELKQDYFDKLGWLKTLLGNDWTYVQQDFSVDFIDNRYIVTHGKAQLDKTRFNVIARCLPNGMVLALAISNDLELAKKIAVEETKRILNDYGFMKYALKTPRYTPNMGFENMLRNYPEAIKMLIKSYERKQIPILNNPDSRQMIITYIVEHLRAPLPITKPATVTVLTMDGKINQYRS